ncbi:neo-calmodulin-like [Argonauta hians]
MDGTPLPSGRHTSGVEPEGASAGTELTNFSKLMNGLQEMGIEDLRQAFEMFDKNHDEKISADELGCVLRTLGFEYCQAEVDDMIKNADTNENGFVEYDEFLTMMQRFSQHNVVSSHTVDEKTREAFRVFDIDGNGYIDKRELQQVMKRLGENISDEDVKEMFREADLNNDGKIDFNEFRQLLGSCKLK